MFSASYPQDRRSYYLFFNYLFFNYLYGYPECPYFRGVGYPECPYFGRLGVSRMPVEKCPESHKPVEIGDLRLLTIQESLESNPERKGR